MEKNVLRAVVLVLLIVWILSMISVYRRDARSRMQVKQGATGQAEKKSIAERRKPFETAPAEILVKSSAADAERIKVATQDFRTPPKITLELQPESEQTQVNIKGDLTDAQRLYAAISVLEPAMKIQVQVQLQKGRKEVVLLGLSEEQVKALKEGKQDPFVALIKAGVDGFTLVYAVAYWDIKQKRPELLGEQNNQEFAQTARAPADFYGITEDVSLADIPDAIGWKQLENRGVKVIYPDKKKE